MDDKLKEILSRLGVNMNKLPNSPQNIKSEELKKINDLLNSLTNNNICKEPNTYQNTKIKKRVLLLAVSCKKGGLCPGGIDMDKPNEWIRIVKDDGEAGAVQGYEIDFAKPLDIIEFEGKPMPQGKQKENWVILNNSCKKVGSKDKTILDSVYQQYAYHGFWGNYRSYLNEREFIGVDAPSESIMKVSNIRIYRNHMEKAKIDFDWSEAIYRIKFVSMTDQDFYDKIKEGDITFDNAYIVISIPKEIDDWIQPDSDEKRAYKFVSKIFPI